MFRVNTYTCMHWNDVNDCMCTLRCWRCVWTYMSMSDPCKRVYPASRVCVYMLLLNSQTDRGTKGAKERCEDGLLWNHKYKQIVNSCSSLCGSPFSLLHPSTTTTMFLCSLAPPYDPCLFTHRRTFSSHFCSKLFDWRRIGIQRFFSSWKVRSAGHNIWLEQEFLAACFVLFSRACFLFVCCCNRLQQSSIWYSLSFSREEPATRNVFAPFSFLRVDRQTVYIVGARDVFCNLAKHEIMKWWDEEFSFLFLPPPSSPGTEGGEGGSLVPCCILMFVWRTRSRNRC